MSSKVKIHGRDRQFLAAVYTFLERDTSALNETHLGAREIFDVGSRLKDRYDSWLAEQPESFQGLEAADISLRKFLKILEHPCDVIKDTLGLRTILPAFLDIPKKDFFEMVELIKVVKSQVTAQAPQPPKALTPFPSVRMASDKVGKIKRTTADWANVLATTYPKLWEALATRYNDATRKDKSDTLAVYTWIVASISHKRQLSIPGVEDGLKSFLKKGAGEYGRYLLKVAGLSENPDAQPAPQEATLPKGGKAKAFDTRHHG